jgi:hypothetical protein
MFEANATRNMGNLGRLVSKDMVGYSIGGRKYVGWDELKPEMQQEFEAVTRLEIPVKDLRVWERGDLAWYTAEIDYIRYVGTGQDERKMLLPLRESGVLERQQGDGSSCNGMSLWKEHPRYYRSERMLTAHLACRHSPAHPLI